MRSHWWVAEPWQSAQQRENVGVAQVTPSTMQGWRGWTFFFFLDFVSTVSVCLTQEGLCNCNYSLWWGIIGESDTFISVYNRVNCPFKLERCLGNAPAAVSRDLMKRDCCLLSWICCWLLFKTDHCVQWAQLASREGFIKRSWWPGCRGRWFYCHDLCMTAWWRCDTVVESWN